MASHVLRAVCRLWKRRRKKAGSWQHSGQGLPPGNYLYTVSYQIKCKNPPKKKKESTPGRHSLKKKKQLTIKHSEKNKKLDFQKAVCSDHIILQCLYVCTVCVYAFLPVSVYASCGRRYDRPSSTACAAPRHTPNMCAYVL